MTAMHKKSIELRDRDKAKEEGERVVLKAIGGSKNPRLVYLKDLNEGEQRLFTECQN